MSRTPGTRCAYYPCGITFPPAVLRPQAARSSRKKRDELRLYKHFNAFFDELSLDHAAFRRTWELKRQSKTDLYESLRCGLVHEYAPKVDTEIRMAGPSATGVAEENGVLIFEVEGYFRAFEKAADRLVARLLLDLDTSALPPVKYRREQDS